MEQPEWKIKHHLNKNKLICIFSHFAVIWVIIFNIQIQVFTGFLRNFVKIIQIGMANFYITMKGWQELEPSLIYDQICQKIIMQLNYGDYLKIVAVMVLSRNPNS